MNHDLAAFIINPPVLPTDSRSSRQIPYVKRDEGKHAGGKEADNPLKKHGYTYPVLMDTNGDLFDAYGVFSYPTTFMIDKDGNVFGYASGQLSEYTMRSIIEQTMKGQRK